MALKIIGELFGIAYNFDIDTTLPLQGIYEFRLKLWLFNKKHLDPKQSKDFIYYALRHLPNESFIIFEFDSAEDRFVQFFNTSRNICIDIPIYPGNIYYTKENELIDLLRSMHITRRYSKKKPPGLGKDRFDILHQGEDQKSIRVNFGRIYIGAADATLLIAQEIFGIKEPSLVGYKTDKLVPAE